MDEPKPVTRWARASLECSFLGWMGGLFLGCFAIVPPPDVFSPGGLIVLGGAAGLTYLLCVAGAFAGIVALLRIRSDGYGGRASAWAGLLLGGVPVLAASCQLLRFAVFLLPGVR